MSSWLEKNKPWSYLLLICIVAGVIVAGGLIINNRLKTSASPFEQVSDDDLLLYYWFGGGAVTTGETGYASINLQLVNGTSVSGYVAILDENGTALLTDIGTGVSNPVENGTTFEAPENSIVTLINVTGVNNSFILPATIYLAISSSQSSPQVNTIVVPLMRNASGVSVTIDELDGVAGDYNESDLSASTEMDIRYNVTEYNPDNAQDGYGLSSWIPALYLPEYNINESVGGYGLFAVFVNASITGTTKLDDFESGAWNITSGDLINCSIALLNPVFTNGATSTLTVTLTEIPDALYIFEGFLDNYTTNQIQIT